MAVLTPKPTHTDTFWAQREIAENSHNDETGLRAERELDEGALAQRQGQSQRLRPEGARSCGRAAAHHLNLALSVEGKEPMGFLISSYPC